MEKLKIIDLYELSGLIKELKTQKRVYMSETAKKTKAQCI